MSLPYLIWGWPQTASTGRKIETAELTGPELTKTLGGKVFCFCFCFLSYKKNKTWKSKAVLSCEGSPGKVQETSQTHFKQFSMKDDSCLPFSTWVLCFWMKVPVSWEVNPSPWALKMICVTSDNCLCKYYTISLHWSPQRLVSVWAIEPNMQGAYLCGQSSLVLW